MTNDSGKNLIKSSDADTWVVDFTKDAPLGTDAGSYMEGKVGPGSTNTSGSGYSTKTLNLCGKY